MMNASPREIELLAPAANIEVAVQAILHGADAVYIGGPGYGARKKAANSIEEIKRLTDFAHTYRVKVYVTVNTIIFDHELLSVEKMIHELYHAGVDALIVQDMGILRLDIPPMQLHASTQCDIRTPEKALFLQEAGFSQLVLARELTLNEIQAITDTVSVPVETFVHGALCVSYSGKCHVSEIITGRSANRGECSQLCRVKYNLEDADGRRLCKEGHLLSLRDFNASDLLEQMLDAGSSSFKIEGRLKDADYVKNVTAAYRNKLDTIIAAHPDKYRRSSEGESMIGFEPKLAKSFNRGFTHYFLNQRKPTGIWSPRTPKSMGEEINDISELHNGDGISYFDAQGEYTGVTVNGIKGNRIIGNHEFRLPQGAIIHRTFDIEWQKKLMRKKAERKIRYNVCIDDNGVTATDTRGLMVRLPLGIIPEPAKKPMDFRGVFEKTGNTPYRLAEFTNKMSGEYFIPLSHLTTLRRSLIETLDKCNRASYPYPMRRQENRNAKFPLSKLSFAENVANHLAAEFYKDHGVTEIEPAIETLRIKGASKTNNPQRVQSCRQVMTTRHCILRELGKCRKEGKSKGLKFPLFLKSDSYRLRCEFDCDACEMHIFD